MQTLPAHPPPAPAARELREILHLSRLPSPSCRRASVALHRSRCQPVFRENIEFLAIKEGPGGVVCAVGHVHRARSLFNRSAISSQTGGVR